MVIGLTGGIGCGKSLALNKFEELGWTTVDADALCHHLYTERDKKLFKQLANRWSKDIFLEDGSADRAKIAEIVFNDEQELAWLNSVIHPLVMERAKMLISELKQQWIMFDVPLLFEVGWQTMFASTISIWTTSDIQQKRLLERGWSVEQINARIKNQWPVEQKLELATYGIINTGSETLLIEQCERINNIIKGI